MKEQYFSMISLARYSFANSVLSSFKNKVISVPVSYTHLDVYKRQAFEQIDRLLEEGAILQTIFSDISQHIKCRFGKGEEFVKRAHDMTGNEPMKTIEMCIRDRVLVR